MNIGQEKQKQTERQQHFYKSNKPRLYRTMATTEAMTTQRIRVN